LFEGERDRPCVSRKNCLSRYTVYTSPPRTSPEFEGVPGQWDPSADQPRIFSSGVDEPWGALSGLAASLDNDLELETWDAFFYPLESSAFTIGLSEIVLAGTTLNGADVYAVIERDNHLSANGLIKRVYTFTLDGLAPADVATAVSATSIAGSAVSKQLLRDVQPQFTPYEKVEGLAVTWGGDLWVALDNDGGEFESRLVRHRK
jgi:hypothetical protein